jgi:hypothetical protein
MDSMKGYKREHDKCEHFARIIYRYLKNETPKMILNTLVDAHFPTSLETMVYALEHEGFLADKFKDLEGDMMKQMTLINKLREKEGTSVEICCDNPDFDSRGINNKVILRGIHHASPWEFTGSTLIEALENALKQTKNLKGLKHETKHK